MLLCASAILYAAVPAACYCMCPMGLFNTRKILSAEHYRLQEFILNAQSSREFRFLVRTASGNHSSSRPNTVTIMAGLAVSISLLICSLMFTNLLLTLTDKDVSARAANGKSRNVCRTPTCKAAARKFLDSMNLSADPCEDFFEYACRGWIVRHPILDNETEVDDFYYQDLKMKKVGQKLLQKPVNQSTVFPSETIVKNFFKQCTNEEQVEKLRSKPVLDLLDDVVGGWPVLTTNWTSSNFDIYKAIVKAFFARSDPFFRVTIKADVENPKINLIQVDAPLTFAGVDVLSNSVTGKLYVDSILKFLFNLTALLLRDTNSTTRVEALSINLTDIIQTEREFSMAKLTSVEQMDEDIYLNKMTLKQFQTKYNFNSTILQNFTLYLEEYFNAANISERIHDDTTIVLPNLRFWYTLDKKLVEFQQQGEDGKRRIAVFIGWKLVDYYSNFLCKDYRDAANEHIQRITGRVKRRNPPIGELCWDTSAFLMPLAVGVLYVRDEVPKNMKTKASVMIRDIQAGFRHLLVSESWMDFDTRQAALQKLKAMINVVGYPDIFRTNVSLVDAEYEAIVPQPTFVGTVLKTFENIVIRNLRYLARRNPRYDPIRDTDDITAVNAYYNPNINSLIINAVMLQRPFYETEGIQSHNYGAIGYVIGHETTHGFDNNGAKYDDQGVRRVWWTKKTMESYTKNTKGMRLQYDNYTMPAGKVNGELTLGENIADNGGLRAAHLGFTDYLHRLTQPEATLPGMETFTSEQLFFLSAGQVWCQSTRIEAERTKILTDEHAPNRWRVNGALSNMPEFARAFNCSANAEMNPKVRQVVW